MFCLKRRRGLIPLIEFRSAWKKKKKKNSVDAPEMSLLEWFHKEQFFLFFVFCFLELLFGEAIIFWECIVGTKDQSLTNPVRAPTK